MATTKQLVRSALLGAFVFAGKWVLSGLPNIHPVALLVLIYTVCLGARSALAATAVYVMLEGLFYGFGDWWLAYCWDISVGCILQHERQVFLFRSLSRYKLY